MMTAPRPTTTTAGLPNDQDASGRSFGDDVVARLTEVIRSGTLTATKGAMTPQLEQRFADLLGVRHAVACSSGTAAIHAAVAALELEPGSEVVTTSVTDMGALAPLVYQGLIPVFADVEATTGNITPATVDAVWSERTRAVIATHLFGRPADVDTLRRMADERGVALIEDAAQAFLAKTGGRPVGSIGHVGCFSFQQGKHITSGEGGIVVTDDDELAHEVRLFVNKSWPYGEAEPDHRKLGLNYRITELQSAVLTGQLPHLPAFVARRQRMAERLVNRLEGVPGILPAVAAPGDEHTYWRYPLVVQRRVLPTGVSAIATALQERGAVAAPLYIGKPAFRCGVFAHQRTLGASHWPFTLADPSAVDYDAGRFPGTFDFLDAVVVIGMNERYEERHVDLLAETIRSTVERLLHGRHKGDAVA